MLPNPLPAGRATTDSPPAEPGRPSAPVPAPAGLPTALPGAEQLLTLTFRDFSWTEIRDRDGRLLLSGMNPGGTAQSVSGTPPFEVVIGNATDVRLTYKGSPFDLAPHTRQNVARFRLP
jgi:cytoskeleton protein RodZ